MSTGLSDFMRGRMARRAEDRARAAQALNALSRDREQERAMAEALEALAPAEWGTVATSSEWNRIVPVRTRVRRGGDTGWTVTPADHADPPQVMCEFGHEHERWNVVELAELSSLEVDLADARRRRDALRDESVERERQAASAPRRTDPLAGDLHAPRVLSPEEEREAVSAWAAETLAEEAVAEWNRSHPPGTRVRNATTMVPGRTVGPARALGNTAAVEVVLDGLGPAASRTAMHPLEFLEAVPSMDADPSADAGPARASDPAADPGGIQLLEALESVAREARRLSAACSAAGIPVLTDSIDAALRRLDALSGTQWGGRAPDPPDRRVLRAGAGSGRRYVLVSGDKEEEFECLSEDGSDSFLARFGEGEVRRLYYADCGMEPYADGSWNPCRKVLVLPDEVDPRAVLDGAAAEPEEAPPGPVG